MQFCDTIITRNDVQAVVKRLWNTADVTALLQKRGADTKLKDNRGTTALAKAVDPAIIQLLKNAGAKP